MATRPRTFRVEGVFPPPRFHWLLICLLVLVTYLSNFRSINDWRLHPGPGAEQFLLEPLLWLVAALLAVRISGELPRLPQGFWREQYWLVAFVFLAGISVLWSSNPQLTAMRALMLLASTGIAIVLGSASSPRHLLIYLMVTATVMLVAVLWMVMDEPLRAISRGQKGAWRGVFWNKNHLGPFAALANAIFLLSALDSIKKQRKWLTSISLVLYGLALFTAVKSRSSTSIVLLLALNLSVLVCASWLRFHSRLGRAHYILASTVVAVIAVLAVANLEKLFALFGKGLSMSGRTLLWDYAVQNYLFEQPWLGHGFNAVWSDPGVRLLAKTKLGFVYPMIGDNGYLDIALGLGVVGLLVFMMVFFKAWRASFQIFAIQRTISSSLPLVIMAFASIVNLTFSMFVEIEFLVWGLMVAIIAMGASIRRESPRHSAETNFAAHRASSN